MFVLALPFAAAAMLLIAAYIRVRSRTAGYPAALDFDTTDSEYESLEVS